MARSFLGGEFASGESAWWRGNWIPPLIYMSLNKNIRSPGSCVMCYASIFKASRHMLMRWTKVAGYSVVTPRVLLADLVTPQMVSSFLFHVALSFFLLLLCFYID